jgi:glutamate dehydrogenase/leucine dehydrogenase
MAPGSLRGLDVDGQRHPAAGSPSCTVVGVVAATAWACGGDLAGRTAAIEGAGSSPIADQVAEALQAAGARIVSPEGVETKPWLIWGADADVVLCGTKPGILNHQGAAMVKASVIVPWGPIPVTTKAYVMLNRMGRQVLPDFVAAACGLAAEYLPDAGSMHASELATVASGLAVDILAESATHPEGVMMGGFERAENFLTTWTDFEPFGRPLAA